MKDIFQIKTFTEGASFKDVDPKKRIISGYFAAFDSVDADNDIITPGAFKKTIQENGPSSNKPRIKFLLDHDPSKGLGKLISLKEDSHGLAYEAQIGSHALGQDFIKQVESGVITEHSIGYQTVSASKGKGVKYLNEIRLYEGSALTFLGANGNTPVTGLKSLNIIDRAAERIELIRKSYHENQYADEAIDLIDIELKQLQQLFVDNTQAAQAPEPEVDEAIMDELQDLRKYFIDATRATKIVEPKISEEVSRELKIINARFKENRLKI